MTRVTQAEAARQLDVNRSTVSRWVKRNPALADEAGSVLVDELRQFSLSVLNPGNQTRGAADVTATPASMDRAPVSSEPNLNDHRTRREAATAMEAELDLAERLTMTLRRDEVEAAAADAGEVMRQVAGQIVRESAERMARIDDVREMERALDAMMREVLSKGAAALRKMAAGHPGDEAAA